MDRQTLIGSTARDANFLLKISKTMLASQILSIKKEHNTIFKSFELGFSFCLHSIGLSLFLSLITGVILSIDLDVSIITLSFILSLIPRLSTDLDPLPLRSQPSSHTILIFLLICENVYFSCILGENHSLPAFQPGRTIALNTTFSNSYGT